MENPPISDPATDAAVTDVCLSCGLCCRGALYTHVALKDKDEITFAEGLGLKVIELKEGMFFTQPCGSFKDEKCSIYLDRFERCQSYSCMLIGRLRAGQTTREDALKVVHDLRQRFDVVSQNFNPEGDPISINKMVARETLKLPDGSIATLPVERQRAFLELGALSMLLQRHIDSRHHSIS